MAEKIRIQGHSVGSQNEVNVAMALDQLNYTYEYQYLIGLTGVRGSKVIDFLVYTIPKPTPLFVHGEYWHKGKKAVEDELKLTEIATQSRNHWAEPKIIWGEDCETVEDAYKTLQKLLY
jgi:hypothetical protein